MELEDCEARRATAWCWFGNDEKFKYALPEILIAKSVGNIIFRLFNHVGQGQGIEWIPRQVGGQEIQTHKRI